jgi:hypothetical protein
MIKIYEGKKTLLAQPEGLGILGIYRDSLQAY